MLGETRDPQSFFDLEHVKCSASSKNLVLLLGTQLGSSYFVPEIIKPTNDQPTQLYFIVITLHVSDQMYTDLKLRDKSNSYYDIYHK